MEQIIQNTAKTFSLNNYIIDRGWKTPSSNSISRTSENSGDLGIPYSIGSGVEYEWSLVVNNISNGSIVIIIGGVTSTPITTSGYHQGTITATNSTDRVIIWSDADASISSLNLMVKQTSTEAHEGSDTITWSEQRKGWVTFKDMIPESGFSMYSHLFTLKDGHLWKHTLEGTYNNFYGVQYSSKVKFPVSSVGVKTYHTIALHSNKVLGTTQDGITTELGNVTDLVTFDFDSREGIHYANKLRDAILDDKLKGRYIVIELTDEETNTQKLQLFKVVVKSEISTPSE